MNKEEGLFTVISRKADHERLQQKQYDLVVIGGGITGAGIALDAASRGLEVVLLEKSDFGSGTSSKSTKLIHGGLRYLKQMEIGLVRESGTERAIVHRLAPHLVVPEKMLLPLIKGGTFGRFGVSIGLMVYDFLARVKGRDRRKMLNKDMTLKTEPLLKNDIVTGGGLYAEYRTDDARLTIENIKTAVRNGATCINYAEVNGFEFSNGKVCGVTFFDHVIGQKVTIRAKNVVSAAGPWVDKVREINQSIGEKRLHLTKGVHIVVPYHKFPARQAIYFDAPDGRMIFAIPRGKTTYIGTSDTTYQGDLEHVVVTQADLIYLINSVKRVFEGITLEKEDVISNWAGLRPLIYEEGKSPSQLSRRDEIFEAKDGLLSIAGGKLTGYRKMAQRIVDRVTKKEGKFKACLTDQIALTEDPFQHSEEVENEIEQIGGKLLQLGLDPLDGRYLISTYGRKAWQILDKFENSFLSKGHEGLILAELWYGVHYEMVQGAADFFVRRTGRLFFDIESVQQYKGIVMLQLQIYLGWDDQRMVEEKEHLDNLLHDATNYYQREISDI